jgi:hypothetical protein
MTIPKKNKAEEEPSPGLHLNERYPDPAVEVLDPSFDKIPDFQRGGYLRKDLMSDAEQHHV